MRQVQIQIRQTNFWDRFVAVLDGEVIGYGDVTPEGFRDFAGTLDSGHWEVDTPTDEDTPPEDLAPEYYGLLIATKTGTGLAIEEESRYVVLCVSYGVEVDEATYQRLDGIEFDILNQIEEEISRLGWDARAVGPVASVAVSNEDTPAGWVRLYDDNGERYGKAGEILAALHACQSIPEDGHLFDAIESVSTQGTPK